MGFNQFYRIIILTVFESLLGKNTTSCLINKMGLLINDALFVC